MHWFELHAKVLEKAFEQVLGKAELGAMAFVRCLSPEVIKYLAAETNFKPPGWRVRRVADIADSKTKTITADNAVELREIKQDAVLLLVDTTSAGAGMDGIYSAARDIDESSLFREALRLARNEVTRHLSRPERLYAERAVKKARGPGRRFSISFWTEFDFLIRIAATLRPSGEYLHLLGLWPVQSTESSNVTDDLDQSRMFIDRLLATTVSGQSPALRIKTLKLLNPSREQVENLEQFLRTAATKPLVPALTELEDKKHLWVNALRIESAAQTIQEIELTPWRTTTGKVAKWSGLIEESDSDAPPVLVLEPDAELTGQYSKLEVRWKARPDNLRKDAVQYRIFIETDMEEELAFHEVSHSAKKGEKFRFSNDDFSELSEDALISAKVIVSVIGNDTVEAQESEEFVIRFGHLPEQERGGVGKKVRTFSEGLIELSDREQVSIQASANTDLPVDSKGFVLLRTQQPGKSFRVYQPLLIAEVEKQWAERAGKIGRWRVKVRTSGSLAGPIEFLPLPSNGSSSSKSWERTANLSRRMAERLTTSGGGVSQIYDQNTKIYDNVIKEYLLAWTALLEKGDPSVALANTVEVQSLSGRTIGLIVLPSHPIRVAWQVAYDNLVLYTAFEQNMTPKDVRSIVRL